MRFLRLLLAALCLAVLGSVTMPAHAAGTLSVNTTTPMWAKRSQTDRKLDFINRRDCLDDATISFVATFAGSPGGAFEVWSGTNCDTLAARTPATATCVKAYSGTSGVNQTVTVRVQNIIRALTDDPTNAAAGDAKACDASNSMSASTRALHFVVYDAGSNMSLIPTTPKWSFKYDTVGPNPPTGITTSSGESSLSPHFTAPTGEATLIRYHFFCSEAVTPADTGVDATAGSAGTSATGGTGVTDAAAGTDTGGTGATAGTEAGGTGATAGTEAGGTDAIAGTDTGGTTTTAGTSSTSSSGTGGSSSGTIDKTCGSSSLVPGEDPPAGLKECGTVTAMGADSGETDAVLENSVRYAIAIAAEDDANNIGKLSALACGVPQEVTGFFEAYRAAGGQAGGGYCSFAPARRGAAAVGLAMLLGACALVARRRK